MVTTWSGGDPFALVVLSRSRAQSDFAARGSRTVVSATVRLSAGELDTMQSKLPWAPQGATSTKSASTSKGRAKAKPQGATPRAEPGGQSAKEDLRQEFIKEEATRQPSALLSEGELEQMFAAEMLDDLSASEEQPVGKPENQEQG